MHYLIKSSAIVCTTFFLSTPLFAQTIPSHKEQLKTGLHALIDESYEFKLDSQLKLVPYNKDKAVSASPKNTKKTKRANEYDEVPMEFIGGLFQTYFNIMGDTKASVHGGWNHKKKLVSVDLKSTTKSHNLESYLHIPLLFDYKSYNLVLGVTELNPMILSGTKVSTKDHKKYIRFSLPVEDNEFKQNEQKIEDWAKRFINLAIDSLPEEDISSIPLITEDKIYGAQHKIRLTLSQNELQRIMLSSALTVASEEEKRTCLEKEEDKSECNEYDQSDSIEMAVNELMDEQFNAFPMLWGADITPKHLAELQALFAKKMPFDIYLDNKYRIVGAYSPFESFPTRLFLPMTSASEQLPDFGGESQMIFKYSSNPKLPFNPPSRNIVDYPKDDTPTIDYEEVEATEAIGCDDDSIECGDVNEAEVVDASIEEF